MKLSDMLIKLVNANNADSFFDIIKEMHELFIYVDYQYYKRDYDLCLRIFIYSLKIYHSEV